MTNYTIAYLTDTAESVEYILKLKESSHTVKVYTDDNQVAKVMAENGIDPVLDRGEALAGSEIVITYYDDLIRSESAYLARKGGLLTSCGEKTLFVNMSRTTPAIARDIASVADLNGSCAVDAPVNAVGSIFVGAEKTDSEKLTSVIEVMSEKVFWLGSAGAGVVGYLAEEVCVSATLMGMCDAMALCQVEDVNLDRVVEMLKGSMARSFVTNVYAQKAADGDYKDKLTTAGLRRDVAVALMRADERELALPASQTAFTLLDTLCEMGGSNLGIQTMSVMYQDEEQAAAAGLDWSNVADGDTDFGAYLDANDSVEPHADHCHDEHCGCDHE